MRFGGFSERLADVIVTVGAHVQAVPTEAPTKARDRRRMDHWSALRRCPRAAVFERRFVAVKEPIEVQPVLGDG